MPRQAPFQKQTGHSRQVRVYFAEWRKARGLTQQQLADRIGTSKTRVSMKERGEEGWDDGYLAALAEALGLEEPASLLMRDPTIPDAAWSIVDSLKPENRAKVREYIQLLADAEKRDAA